MLILTTIETHTIEADDVEGVDTRDLLESARIHLRNAAHGGLLLDTEEEALDDLLTKAHAAYVAFGGSVRPAVIHVYDRCVTVAAREEVPS